MKIPTDSLPDPSAEFAGLFRRAMEAADISAFAWEPVADRVILSEHAQTLLGAAAGRLDYAGFLQLVHPEDRELTDRTLRASLAEGSSYNFDFRAAGAGPARWIRARGRADSFGAAGVLVDVVGLRAAEAAKNRLAAVVTSSDDAIIAKTLDGIITDWNRGAEALLGYRAEEMIGRSIATLVPPGQEDEAPRILERIRHGLRIDHYETRRRRKDGEIIDVSLTVSPIYDDAGRLLGASKVARDITEQRKIRHRLAELQAELFHMSRYTAMGEMASTLAHELNQPLTAIASYLNGCRWLLENSRDPQVATLREAVERAAEQALRAGQIIRRLRDFVARGETERQAEGLGRLIEEAGALALVGIRETGVLVSFSLPPGEIRVLVDRIQIQQVLLNLIRNAIEAMGESSRRELHIAAACHDDDLAEITVTDTGTGIEAEIEGQLFQPFITTKPHGMGVGLSISRAIIEAHGGRLWVEPNPDGGAVFHLTLQRLHDAETEDAG